MLEKKVSEVDLLLMECISPILEMIHSVKQLAQRDLSDEERERIDQHYIEMLRTVHALHDQICHEMVETGAGPPKPLGPRRID